MKPRPVAIRTEKKPEGIEFSLYVRRAGRRYVDSRYLARGNDIAQVQADIDARWAELMRAFKD